MVQLVRMVPTAQSWLFLPWLYNPRTKHRRLLVILAQHPSQGCWAAYYMALSPADSFPHKNVVPSFLNRTAMTRLHHPHSLQVKLKTGCGWQIVQSVGQGEGSSSLVRSGGGTQQRKECFFSIFSLFSLHLPPFIIFSSFLHSCSFFSFLNYYFFQLQFTFNIIL